MNSRPPPSHFLPRSLRTQVEALAARGLGSHAIARQLKCAHSYVWRITNANTHADIRTERLDDSEHVERVLAAGGFPAFHLPAKQRVRA